MAVVGIIEFVYYSTHAVTILTHYIVALNMAALPNISFTTGKSNSLSVYQLVQNQRLSFILRIRFSSRNEHCHQL